jgi:hypothetical protein
MGPRECHPWAWAMLACLLPIHLDTIGKLANIRTLAKKFWHCGASRGGKESTDAVGMHIDVDLCGAWLPHPIDTAHQSVSCARSGTASRDGNSGSGNGAALLLWRSDAGCGSRNYLSARRNDYATADLLRPSLQRASADCTGHSSWWMEPTARFESVWLTADERLLTAGH